MLRLQRTQHFVRRKLFGHILFLLKELPIPYFFGIVGSFQKARQLGKVSWFLEVDCVDRHSLADFVVLKERYLIDFIDFQPLVLCNYKAFVEFLNGNLVGVVLEGRPHVYHLLVYENCHVQRLVLLVN